MKTKYFENTYEKIKTKKKPKPNTDWNRLWRSDVFQCSVGFTCGHCHEYVHSDPLLSGVNNRNHCPYCLWSKHVDLYESGDRLAACKGAMQPIGLSIKKSHKKYGHPFGEMMIIHLCSECGGISINRIATDDDVDSLRSIFHTSHSLNAGIITRLDNDGIIRLDKSHAGWVSAVLADQK